MKEKELISVIIPVYNIEDYLPRCLETISQQTYRHLEIILVDDGSTDRSGEICDAYVEKDNRACVIHQRNQGVWAARNSGKSAAHGEYLMFPDGDDYLHVDAVNLMYEAINRDVCFDIAIVERKITNRPNEDIQAEGANILTVLSQKDLIANMFSNHIIMPYWSQWDKLYRKKLIESLWSEEYQFAQDYDFNFRVFLNVNKAVFIRRPLYFYVQRPSSAMKRSDYWDILYACKCRMLFTNYFALPSCKKNYGHYLLNSLYTQMLIYKNRYYKTTKQQEVFQQCRNYFKSTYEDYWLCGKIPLHKKIVVTFLLYSPRLTSWLMKITNN